MINAHHLFYEESQKQRVKDILQDLKNYLRKKLRLVEVKGGGYAYYTCKEDNRFCGNKPDPFKHMKAFCEERGLDWEDVKDWIEDIERRELRWESQLVNDTKAMKLARLRRFGCDVDGIES